MWLCTKCLRTVKKQAVIKPKEKAPLSSVEAKVEVKDTQSHTLSEDIEKAADVRTLSEDIQKAASKTPKKQKEPAQAS